MHGVTMKFDKIINLKGNTSNCTKNRTSYIIAANRNSTNSKRWQQDQKSRKVYCSFLESTFSVLTSSVRVVRVVTHLQIFHGNLLKILVLQLQVLGSADQLSEN